MRQYRGVARAKNMVAPGHHNQQLPGEQEQPPMDDYKVYYEKENIFGELIPELNQETPDRVEEKPARYSRPLIECKAVRYPKSNKIRFVEIYIDGIFTAKQVTMKACREYIKAGKYLEAQDGFEPTSQDLQSHT